MKNKWSTIYLILVILTFVIWYVYLKYAYVFTWDNAFLQEIILIVLWTIVTIFITASLLNKQSEVELEKEQRIKIFDIKSSFYIDLINMIEDFIEAKKVSKKDLLKLEFLTHKISIIADYNVLKEYSNFLKVFKEVVKNKNIDEAESEKLSIQLAELCEKIRNDLLKIEWTNDDVKKIIVSNINKI